MLNFLRNRERDIEIMRLDSRMLVHSFRNMYGPTGYGTRSLVSWGDVEEEINDLFNNVERYYMKMTRDRNGLRVAVPIYLDGVLELDGVWPYNKFIQWTDKLHPIVEDDNTVMDYMVSRYVMKRRNESNEFFEREQKDIHYIIPRRHYTDDLDD